MKEIKFCHIRRLKLKYLNGLLHLLQKELTLKERKYFPTTKNEILSLLPNVKDYFYILVDQDDEVLAFGQMRTFDGKYKIPSLGVAVSKFCRGLGLGELLCRSMLFDMQKEGFEKILLKVDRKNKKALKLYEKLGFNATKKTKTRFWMIKEL